MQGYGVFYWNDGRKYEGQFEDNKQHGFGKYTLQDGTIKYGIYENGIRKKWVDKDGNDIESKFDN